VPSTKRTRIDRYDPAAIEPRWQQRWAELGLHEADLTDVTRPKFYLLTGRHAQVHDGWILRVRGIQPGASARFPTGMVRLEHICARLRP